MANLSPKHLFKYDYRIQLFLDKIWNHEYFDLIDGSKQMVRFIYFNGNEFSCFIKSHKALAKKELLARPRPKKIEIEVDRGVILSSSYLKKTKEFGGKDLLDVYSAEYATLFDLKTMLSRAIEENGGPINLKFGTKIYKNIASVEKNEERNSKGQETKADFKFLDSNGITKIWISHKNLENPRRWQQYSGVSFFTFNKKVKDFVRKVKRSHHDFIKDKSNATFYMELQRAKILMLKSVYGMKYNYHKYNSDNVNALCIGKFNLSKTSDYYVLTAQKSWFNGDVPNGDYKPVMIARKSKERSTAGIKNCRILICPKMGMTGKLIALK